MVDLKDVKSFVRYALVGSNPTDKLFPYYKWIIRNGYPFFFYNDINQVYAHLCLNYLLILGILNVFSYLCIV